MDFVWYCGLYMHRIRRISRRVFYCYRASISRVGLLLGLILISNQVRVLAQSEPSQVHLMSYIHVQEPDALVDISSSIPTVFQDNSFSIYLLTSASSPLEWILCTESDDSIAWSDISNERNWTFANIPGYRLFFSQSSNLKTEASVIESVKTHLIAEASTSISVGLLPGWNAGLKLLYDNEKARTQLFTCLYPGSANHSLEYADYLQWFAQELMSLNSLDLSIDNVGNEKKTTLRITTIPGTRLNRLVSRKGEGNQSVLDFVPANAANIIYGSIDGIFAGSYFNYHFQATNMIENDLFRNLRSGLNQLDAGIIDRWDGSWVKWSAEGSEASHLILGGDFQSSDLGELFDMFSGVDLFGSPISIQLDEENSVVGFSRIRSLDIYDSEIEDVRNSRPLHRFFFCVAQGFLVISDSDSELIDLVFSLNSRSVVKDSARKLVPPDPIFAISSFENGDSVGSVRMNDGRIFYEKTGGLELTNPLIVRFINILNL